MASETRPHDEFECLAWKLNPAFWRGVAAIKAAQSAGAIKDREACLRVVNVRGAVAERFGIPFSLGGTFRQCACEILFSDKDTGHVLDPVIALPVFSAEFYLAIHPDLQNTFGQCDYQAATQHWQNLGISEGRRSSPAFDVSYYLSIYPDLSVAFGPQGYKAAVHHWIAHEGLDERRRSADIFDVCFYLQKYPNLGNALGGGSEAVKAATLHWVRYGLSEGRQGSEEFDVRCYLNNYPDLKTAFGPYNWWKAAIHWLLLGKSEGRKGSA